MNKLEMLIKYNDVKKELEKIQTTFLESLDPFIAQCSDYVLKIFSSFITAAAVNHKDILKSSSYYNSKELAHLILPYDSYKLTNAFVTLKFYLRKISKIKSTFSSYKSKLRELLRDYIEIQKYLDSIKLSDRTASIYSEVVHDREWINSALKFEVYSEPDYVELINILFSGGSKLTKEEFLSIINIDKGKKHWDGNPIEIFQKTLELIPDELGFDDIENLIFMEKIENDRDNYLFWCFMEHTLKVMDQVKKETGLTIFDAMEQVTGKPLQTFSLKTNEYDEIVGVEPTKPRLKVIK